MPSPQFLRILGLGFQDFLVRGEPCAPRSLRVPSVTAPQLGRRRPDDDALPSPPSCSRETGPGAPRGGGGHPAPEGGRSVGASRQEAQGLLRLFSGSVFPTPG